jgi:dolichol-phosphate mannosyltransferase
MMVFAVDAFTSFSIVPLRAAFWIGFLSAGLAGLLLIYTMVRWLAGETVIGWASTMGVTVFFAGVQLAVLGVIGEYLGRLVQEGKRRPLFLIDRIVGRPLGSERHLARHGGVGPDRTV